MKKESNVILIDKVKLQLKVYKEPSIYKMGDMKKITHGSLSHCADGSNADRTLEPTNQGCNSGG